MNLVEQMASALLGLRDHAFRTFLTMLGVIFGVGAVIAMVSIGAGAEREALEELKRFGANSIRITSRPLEGEPLRSAVKKLARGLSESDVEFLREACPFVTRAVPEKLVDERLYVMGRKPVGTVVGVGEGFLAASRFELAAGRFFDAEDHAVCRSVVVLGHAVAREAFGEADPLGKVLQIGFNRFRVIGVMQERARSKGRLAIKSRDHDRDVYLPLATVLGRIHKWPVEDKDVYHEITGIWVEIREGADLLASRDAVVRILRRRHRDVDDIESLAPLEILQQSQKTQELFNWVMACIAGISLLVGGIGIMNIMLASVHERIREIGVRRALGATRLDILVQFLTEASLISLVGGLIGIGVGVGISYGISYATGWTTVIPLSSVLLAFGVSLAVGIVFGFFPAWRAADLDPVTALRYE